MPYQPEDIVLEDHEILPMSGRCFGVVLTEEEARNFLDDGYRVRHFQLTKEEKTLYCLEVWVNAKRQDEGFNVAMLETTGRGTIIISPFAWEVGDRSGTKAYLKNIIAGESNIAADDVDATCSLANLCNSTGHCLNPAHCTDTRPTRKNR